MIRNYLLLAFRNFARNKNYTLLNILGLSVGITSCIILFLLILHESSFDKFHHQYDRIYRVVREDKSASGIVHEAVTPYPFGAAFRQDFTDIPLATQFHYQDEGYIAIRDEKHQVKETLFADSLFFDVFDFEVLSGNPRKDLAEPNKAFLTTSMATKLNIGVGDKFKLNNKIDLEVVGLLQDPPPNSHIHFTMMVSLPSFTKDFFGWPVDRWGLNSAGFSYIVLPEKISVDQVNSRFKDFVKKYYPPEEAERNTYLLQPLSEAHFDTRYRVTPGSAANVEVTDLVVLGVLASFILIIACINFINLATALAVKKSKEIGIRKTLGAKRGQLTMYFLSETFLLVIATVIISLCLVEWILPWLRGFLEKDIQFNLFSNLSLLLFLVALIVVATLLSGFYPALILSGFDPVTVLKNKITVKGSSGAFVRRMLVIFQFVIAQMMIVGMLIVTDQMNFFHSAPLGFASEAIVNVPLPGNDPELLNNFRTRLEANPAIRHVSFAVGAPTSDANIGTGFYLMEKGPDDNYGVSIKTVDVHYKDTYGIRLLAGRWFNESEEKAAMDTTLKNDVRYSVIINEAAAKTLGFFSAEEALDKRVHIGLNDIVAPIVGVAEDFHITSLRSKIDPVVMVIYPGLYYDAGIAIESTTMPATIDYIKKTWTELFPGDYFDYEFLDKHLETLYRAEQRQLILFRVFSGISIFIGCLGLLGLVSFMANQKLKEIGVRKVFGASVPSILMIFSVEFMRLVFIAFAIAAPLSYFLMDKWLQNFEYHIAIHWSVFLAGLIVTTLIALLTVGYRSIRAGMANPIESLRAE